MIVNQDDMDLIKNALKKSETDSPIGDSLTRSQLESFMENNLNSEKKSFDLRGQQERLLQERILQERLQQDYRNKVPKQPEPKIIEKKDNTKLDNTKVWLDCRGEKIWTFVKNIKTLMSFAEYCTKEDTKNVDIVMEIDEEKSTIHNLINFISNKRYEDTEKLGDLLSAYGHEATFNNVKTIIEKQLKKVPKYISGTDGTPVWHEDRTIYIMSEYPVYITNIVIKQLKKKHNNCSRVTDEVINKDRFLTFYN